MSMAIIALHIMPNPVLNRLAVLASAISFGSEFHKLIVCCVKKYFPLLVFTSFCPNKNYFVISSLPLLFLFSLLTDIYLRAATERRETFTTAASSASDSKTGSGVEGITQPTPSSLHIDVPALESRDSVNKFSF